MGMSGGSAKPSFTFNDKDALALNQQNAQQLQQYQVQRQKALAGQNSQMAQYFDRTNSLAQDNLLRNMSTYTNALGGYQNSLNQNTADAQSLMNQQQQYYNQVLTGQQQYQNSFAGLMGQYNQQTAADNAAYQQQYLSQLGQYNQDNIAQQQNFMQNYLAQMGQYNQQNIDAQQQYQDAYQNTRQQFRNMKQDVSQQQAAVSGQQQNQALLSMLQNWGPLSSQVAGMIPRPGVPTQQPQGNAMALRRPSNKMQRR